MNIKMVGAAVFAGAMLVGCGKEDGKAEDALAVSVNGEKLMQSAVDADVEKVIASYGGKIPADRLEQVKQNCENMLVSGFIYENVMRAKIKEAGIVLTDADRKEREDEILKAFAKMPNAPKSIGEYFRSFPLGEERTRAQFELSILIDKLATVEMEKGQKKEYAAEARKIVDNVISNNAKAKVADDAALKKIQELKAQLDKVSAEELAKKFAELAKENSACGSKDRGGDLGEFTREMMVKEFSDVAFKLPINKVSDPVKTKYGYHLVMTTKKIPSKEAKGDQPAEPEKVQASHILIAGGETQEVKTLDEVIKELKNADKRIFMQKYINSCMESAQYEASEKYKQFLPRKAESPAVEAAPVEKPAEK